MQKGGGEKSQSDRIGNKKGGKKSRGGGRQEKSRQRCGEKKGEGQGHQNLPGKTGRGYSQKRGNSRGEAVLDIEKSTKKKKK